MERSTSLMTISPEAMLRAIRDHHFLDVTYQRRPDVVGLYLARRFVGRKIYLYGISPHTKAVLESACDGAVVTGVVRNICDGSTDGVVDIRGCKVVSSSELYEKDLDILVLLGVWSEDQVTELEQQLGFSNNKLLAIYSDPDFIAFLDETVRSEIDAMPRAKRKSLALIVAFDRKDLISVAAPEISEFFDLSKVYVENGPRYSELNHPFSQVVDLSGNLNWLIYWLRRMRPYVVVYWVSTQFEFWRAWYVKCAVQEISFFVLGTSDFCFSLYQQNPEAIAVDIAMDLGLARLNAAAEAAIIEMSDGFISNFSGPFSRDVLERAGAPTHFTYGFIRPHQICTNDVIDDGRVHICFLGTLEYVNDPVVNPIFTSSWYVDIFRNILRQGFCLHIYSSTGNKAGDNDPYMELQKNYPEQFLLHDFVPPYELLARISKYHYGLGLMNLEAPIPDVYSYQMSSLLHARIINYLGAGLPVIVNWENIFANRFMEPHGVSVTIDRYDGKDLKEKLNDVDYVALRKAVEQFQCWYANEMPQRAIAKFLRELQAGDVSD